VSGSLGLAEATDRKPAEGPDSDGGFLGVEVRRQVGDAAIDEEFAARAGAAEPGCQVDGSAEEIVPGGHHAGQAEGDADYKDDFWLQVDKLSMADLWNIYLLNEMLSRARVQVSLRQMADGDMADRDSAWGGLVYYQNGQAYAILYPPDPRAKDGDLVYHPTQRFITDSRDSLCHFSGHFEKVNNKDRVGPTAKELEDARERNYYGLILTRTDKDGIAAHYYNPSGIVVSLGQYPLR
jgi:hypothetical protein